MKLSVSAYRAHASAHKKILSSSYQSQFNYGSTAAASLSTPATSAGFFPMDSAAQLTLNNQTGCTSTISGGDMQYTGDVGGGGHHHHHHSSNVLSPQTDTTFSPGDTHTGSLVTSKDDEDDSSNAASSDCKSPGQRTKSNQRWMKLRTTVQISSAIQKKPPLKREDSFLKRFSTRQIPETQETVEDTGSESASGDHDKTLKRRRRYNQKRRSVVNPDENFFFYWLMVLTLCVLYNLWALIVRESFPELQELIPRFWYACDCISDVIFIFDIAVQLRTGYLEQGLMVYDDKKLATHYMRSRSFLMDLVALIPFDLLQFRFGTHPLLRFPRFLKAYRSVKFYYIVESRTVWPNLWRVVNLIHILLILAHWFGCFYYLISEAEGFQGDWVYPYRPGDYATLTRKYLGSFYWSTLTLTTIGDLPTPETNVEPSTSADGPKSIPRRGLKSRLLQYASNYGYSFTIVSYLIGVFIFATIVGQVGNVITNRNANRLEFERLLDGAKTYMRHHKVPGGMKRRVLRWYDYSWSRGRIQGGGDINTALGLLPDKLKTELALHVNLSVLKKVTIFQECQPEFLHDLVLKMRAYIFTPGDSICRKGEVAREMFIIADGILEVLSETGKVLTTMKAGDFFGEIGILNLDGLNKRTADVRSVGYSELFSLSREDVLAAMKDYPEAQEILQTLGRKRLMEVRCVNKKHAKILSDKENQHNNGHDHHFGDRASKRIVEKIRSDVKGIKNVLKKTRRASRKSDESIELQPLHHTIPTQKMPKGVLRRMPRVRSDDMHGESEEQTDVKEKIPSPIGAGLPLLQRLRLLKEKQDREEKATKTSQSVMSSTNISSKTAVSPQQSIQEEPESDVIGAGLPLLQRLKLLKAKETKDESKNQSKAQVTTQISTLTEIVTSTTVTTKPHQSITMSTLNVLPSATIKPSLKVSFKDRVRGLQNLTSTKSEQSSAVKETNSDTIELKDNSMKQSTFSKFSKPSTSAASFSNKIKQLTQSATEDTLKPWSRLKLATVSSCGSYTSLNSSFREDTTLDICTSKKSKIQHIKQPIVIETDIKPKNLSRYASESKFREKSYRLYKEPKHYRSVDDLSPEYCGLPFVKKLKILNERQKLAELESVIKTRSFSLDCGDLQNSDLIESLTRSQSEVDGIVIQRPVRVLNKSEIDEKSCNRQHITEISPESDETTERKHLRSILKRITGDQKIDNGTEPIKVMEDLVDYQQLMKEPTIEGPPNSGKLANEGKSMFPALTESQLECDELTELKRDNIESDLHRTPLKPIISEERDELMCDEQLINKNNSIEKSLNQWRFNKDTVNEQHEYFGEVLLGIKHIIQNHLQEVQVKFQDKFNDMELEIHKRDDIIMQLQQKIRQLEAPDRLSFGGSHEHLNSTDSSQENPFGRGDSLDTIFVNSPPSSIEKPRSRKYRKRSSPKSRMLAIANRDESTDQETELERRKKSRTNYTETLLITDVTGNLTRVLPESVVIDIETPSRVSTSSYDRDSIEDDDEHNQLYEDNNRRSSNNDMENDNEDDDEEIEDDAESNTDSHCNDWEIRMLAAELERRSSKKEDTETDVGQSSTDRNHHLRQRRRISITEADMSESDTDQMIRPRASSLDQHNLSRQRNKGVFKTLSFDRDKDRL